jgi:alpha-D-xyloside xylohydrolase
MKRLAAGLLLMMSACADEASLAEATIGDAHGQVALVDRGRRFQFSRGGQALLDFPVDAIQLGTVDQLQAGASYDPYWLAADGAPPPPPDLRWRQVTSAALALVADSAAVTLHFDGGITANLTLHVDAPGRVRAVLTPDLSAGQHVAYVRLRPRAPDGDGFYGLGEWEDSVEHRGKLRPMQMEVEPTSESFDDEAHVPVPLLIGTSGWGLFVESRRLGAFDVARAEPTLVEITYGTAESSADGLTFHLFAADHPLDITKHYYDVTGLPRLPAEWALGPWIWRDENRDQAQVLDDLQKIRDLDLATSAIWIDRPYATAVNTFDFNPSQFPDPPSMIAAAHAAGLRVALWSAPYLEPAAEPFRDQALAAGYFVPTPGILLNNWSAPIDFTNQAAYDFWQSALRRYTDLGIEGFKLDYAEDVVPSVRDRRSIWKFSDGSDERTMHYGYTLLYHRVYQEVLPPAGSYLLCRAGRWGDQKNVSVIWPGDMDAGFALHGDPLPGDSALAVGGLPATVIMGVGLGPSGFPFFAADTGGYRHSPPDKETFVRWCEQTALSPVMNVGDSSSQTPWEFTAANGRDDEALGIYRVYARLHMRLFPYEWTYAQRLAVDGRSPVRPFGLAWPELGVHPNDQYMFGDDLLVAPVVERGATSRTVVLPPGEWIDWWDGTVYTASTVTVPAPLGKLPLLVRAGAIVPLLRPTVDTMSPATVAGVDSFANDAGALFVRVVPSAQPSSFSVYDGARVDASGAANVARYSVEDGSVFHAGATLEIVETPAPPEQVTANGRVLARRSDAAALDGAVDGWAWEPAVGGTLWIKVGGGGQAVVVRSGK